MITEPVKTFSRKFMGYDTTAVDAHIEMLTAKQQLLIDDVESLRARLQESNEQTAALRKEVAALTDTSPAPHAVQQRMARCWPARSTRWPRCRPRRGPRPTR